MSYTPRRTGVRRYIAKQLSNNKMKMGKISNKVVINGLALWLLLAIGHLTVQASHWPPTAKRAVVFGISDYHDSLFVPLPQAKTDAEQFAAYLRSRSGGLLPFDMIQLVTGKKATLATLLSAGNWVQEESRPGDEVAFYLAGHARMLETGDNPTPYVFSLTRPVCLLMQGGCRCRPCCILCRRLGQGTRCHIKYISILKYQKPTMPKRGGSGCLLSSALFPSPFSAYRIGQRPKNKNRLPCLIPIT